MKRTRPERPSGKPRTKERRRCLKCGRHMARVERGWRKPHQKTWFCRKCWMWWGYLDGVLAGVAGTTTEWWQTKGEWRKAPPGLLLVYGGEEC